MAACLNEETLQAYFDGEFASEAAPGILNHLSGCARCAAQAREIRQALLLIERGFDEELPENVPTAKLRAGIEDALATTPIAAAPGGFSLNRVLSFFDWFRNAEFPSRPIGLAAARLIVAVCLSGGIGYLFWRSAPSETNRDLVREESPFRTELDRKVASRTPANPPASSPRKPKRERRLDDIVHRDAPKPARLAQATQVKPETVALNHRKTFGRTTLQDLETNLHLGRAQLLLRSFRNTTITEGQAAPDLSYEKKLSRELLSKNRLLRRSAETIGGSQTEELLGNIEPLLLDIANLPDKPSQDEVRSIKELIHDQKILAMMQLRSIRPGSSGY